MSNKILEGLKIVGGVAPSSDVYNGDPASDVVSASKYDRVVFLVSQKTAGTNTGTATITVEECDDFTPTTSTAIAFTYYKNEDADSGDTFSAAQSATASGFATTANKTAIYAIEVKAADLTDGYPNVRIVLTEGTDDPVIGEVLILAGEPKYAGSPDSLPTAIA